MDKNKKLQGPSAYSVFNPDGQKLPGTYDPGLEQLYGSARYFQWLGAQLIFLGKAPTK